MIQAVTINEDTICKVLSALMEKGLARELQAPQFQRDEKYAQYRVDLVDGLNGQVVELNDTSWRVRQHLRYVETYREKSAWQNLETASVSELDAFCASDDRLYSGQRKYRR